LFSFNRVLDEDTSWQFLSYYDRLRRNMTAFAMTQDTYNLDYQYHSVPRKSSLHYRRELPACAGLHRWRIFVLHDPPNYATQWASVLAQDTMTLQEDFCTSP